MPEQLSLAVGGPAPTDLPPAAAAILRAAKSMSFSTRIVRGGWGLSVGPKRRWVLREGWCCALSALLVERGAEALDREQSPMHACARVLGVTEREVLAFIDGYDERRPDDGSAWFGYGRRVAKELGVQ